MMALGGGRKIEIDIVANDQSSRVFTHVANSMQGMTGKFNDSVTGINKALNNYNNAIAGMYRGTQVAIAGAGYLLYRFTKESINAFADFEKQHAKTMGAIASNYDKTTSAQQKFLQDQKKLKEESLRLGTVGPTGKGALFNPTQVSYAQTAMAKAGVRPQDMSSNMPAVLKFAGGNDLSIEQATEYAVNLSEMFNIPKNQWGKMLDMVTRAADISTVDVPDIFESMKYAGPIAGSMGRSLEETLAMISTMGNVGLKGSIGGTGIQAFLTRILSPIGKTEKALETAPSDYSKNVLQQFMAEATDSNGRMKSIPDITQKLDEVMNTMNDKEKAWFSQKLFGMFQMKAGYVLAANGGDQLAAMGHDIANNSPGTNDRKWDIMLQSSYGKQLALQNALQGTKTDVGYRLSPLTNAIADELFKALTDTANYKIDFGKLKKAISESSDLIEQQYGKSLGQTVNDLATLGLNGSRAVGANIPLAEGLGGGLLKLLSGDVPGALKTMKDGIDDTNGKIKDLPPELRGMAGQVKNVTLALAAITAMNFASNLLENITTIWRYTIGSVIKAANMNVQAATVVLKDTGVLDKNGNPIYKQGSGTPPKGGAGGSGPVVLGKDGKPIKPAEGSVIVDQHGRPVESASSVPKVGVGRRITKGLGAASWIYAIGEMFGLNDMLLDKAGVQGNMREKVDGVRTGLNWIFTGAFLDDIILKGAGKQLVANIGKSIVQGVTEAAPEVATTLAPVSATAGGVITAGVAVVLKDQANRKNARDEINNAISDKSGDRYVGMDQQHPALDPNGILTGNGTGNVFNVDAYIRANKKRLAEAAYQYGGGQDYLSAGAPKYGSNPLMWLSDANKVYQWYKSHPDSGKVDDTADKNRFWSAQQIYRMTNGEELSWDRYQLTKPMWQNNPNIGKDGLLTQDFLGKLDQINSSISGIRPQVSVAAPIVNVDVKIDGQGNITTKKYITSMGPILDDLYRGTSARSGGGTGHGAVPW